MNRTRKTKLKELKEYLNSKYPINRYPSVITMQKMHFLFKNESMVKENIIDMTCFLRKIKDNNVPGYQEDTTRDWEKLMYFFLLKKDLIKRELDSFKITEEGLAILDEEITPLYLQMIEKANDRRNNDGN